MGKKEIGVLSSGVQRPWRVVNCSHLGSATVKNEWRSTSGVPVSLHGVDRKSFIFLYLCFRASQVYNIQGGSNMTGTDLCVNKPHCAAAVRL